MIKVRVVGKSCNERYYNDVKGCERPWFTMGLCDHSGEIRAFAFDVVCRELYDVFQVDKLYCISGGLVKPASKEQNNMKNIYDLELNEDTRVEECEDTMLLELPNIKFKFVPLKKIYELDMGSYVDVIGVCISASGILNRNSRVDGSPLSLREITLIDPTRRPVTVVLWESDAKNFSSKGNPVVAIKGAGVSQFLDRRQLRCPIGVIINPVIEETEMLRTWFTENYIPSIFNLNAEADTDEEDDEDDYE